MRKDILTLVLPAIAFAQSDSRAPKNLSMRADTLTLNQCVQIALEHNPSIRVAEGGLQSSESNLELSRSVLMPQISDSGGNNQEWWDIHPRQECV